MPLKARVRALRTLDTNRLSQAASRPGADPRTWVAIGKIEEIGLGDQGLVVALRIIEGPLAKEIVPCEVASSLASSSTFTSAPFQVGDIAVCVIPQGDANVMPIVIGFLHAPSRLPPKTVNGETLSASLLRAAFVIAASQRAEVSLAELRVTADKLELADVEPSQPYMRGKDFVDALSTFLTTVETASTAASQACVGPLAPLKAFFDPALPTSLAGAIKIFKAKLVDGVTLSTKIFGE